VRACLWGVRGSIPAPGPQAAGFGGNTSCVQITTADGCELILDAGTGIRELGARLVGTSRRVHVLLTHLHLDHIQGLMFFAPFFDPEAEITVWGPPAAGRSLRERLARYISSPLSPIEIRDLPAKVAFESAPLGPWRIGGVEIRTALVSHRGATLGYRLTEDGSSLCYLPDHEPALAQDLSSAGGAWISGYGLARDVSVLIHDCQYADDEYRRRRGWGHSRLTDALTFAARCEPGRLLLFHHDPEHDDGHLEALGKEASDRWAEVGEPGMVEMAREGRALEVRETGAS
jgi:phosphoribosyl 1,2-cyclic phosphodiesterase